MYTINWTTTTDSGSDTVEIDAKDIASANADPVAFAELVLKLTDVQTANLVEQGE